MCSHRSRLDVTFAGLNLKSPIVAASAPPTETVSGLIACARSGAGAVITKSIVDYNRSNVPATPRRVLQERQRLWIQGSFASETLTLEEGLALVSAARDKVDIPIIASVGVLELDSGAAIETASRLATAGADFVHFDLFYLPQPRSTDATATGMRNLFAAAKRLLPIPFGPKLNIEIPAHWFARGFGPSEIDGVFLLDSVRTPPPLSSRGDPRINGWTGGLECSLFGGNWQKPITLQYTRVLADAGLSALCAGGGFASAEDIMEAILLGATTVQAATPIILHGYDWITRTLERLERLLEDRGHSCLSDLRGLALKVRDQTGPERAIPMRAFVDANRCVPCGVCTKLAFCAHIEAGQGGRPDIAAACSGCGLCAALCPPKHQAIRMEVLR